MHIAVIIPTHNRCHTLGRSLDSVIKQRLDVTDIIVVDDGSSDQTGALLKHHYPQVHYIDLKTNTGVSHARNAGIKATDCEWLAFLDSDDEWLPNKLKHQIETLEANDEFAICHTDEIWIRNGRRVNPMRKHAKQGGNIFLNCLPRCAISPSSVLIHRKIFDDIGLFDETLPACEDYDLWLRICSRYPVLFINEKLIIKYGGHEDQLSTRHWGMDRFRVQALEKIVESHTLAQDYQVEVLKTLIEKLTVLGNGAEKRSNTLLHENCAIKVTIYQGMLSRYKINDRNHAGEQSQ